MVHWHSLMYKGRHKTWPVLFWGPQSCISLDAVPQACIQFHELACNCISFHAVSWACTQLHRLACICMQLHISLSEQLTRTLQCLLWFSKSSIVHHEADKRILKQPWHLRITRKWRCFGPSNPSLIFLWDILKIKVGFSLFTLIQSWTVRA